MKRKHAVGCPCCGCRTLRLTVVGCGPVETGGSPNPTVWVVPGASVEVYLSGVLVGSGTADGSGIVDIPVSSAGTYAVSGTGPYLSGSKSVVVTCGAGNQPVTLNMTDDASHACLRGVLYRPLQNSLVLTDSQASRTLTFGQNLRGAEGYRWDACATVNTTHQSTGTAFDEDCTQATGDVRMMYEFGSSFHSGTGLWRPTLTQLWLAKVCGGATATTNFYTIRAGGSCPPPNPSGLGDFNSSAAQLATSWSSGPPFTATFDLPTDAFTPGSTISRHWLPMAGTVTVSEVP